MGVAIYMGDNDDALPVGSVAGRPTAVGWGARIYEYVKSEENFRCPLEGKGEVAPRVSYAMNANVAEVPRTEEVSSPTRSVLLYEVAGTPPVRPTASTSVRKWSATPSATFARSPVGDGAAGGLLDSTDPDVPPTATPATGPLANSGLPEDTPSRHEGGSSFCFLDTSVRFLKPGEVSAGANAAPASNPERGAGCARPDLPGVPRPCAEGSGHRGRRATFSLR